MKHLKKIVTILVVVSVLGFFQNALAVGLLYEPFPSSYGDYTSIATAPASNVWNVGNANGVGVISNSAAAGLSYSGLQTSAGSYGAYMSSITPSANRNRGALFSSVNSGELYASFLLNIQSASPVSNRLFAALSTATGGSSVSAQAASIWLNEANQLRISKSSSSGLPTSGTTAALSAGTHLVVVRYTFDAANPDPFELWLDPGSLGAGAAPASTLSIASADVLTSGLTSFWLAKTTAGNWLSSPIDLYVDEIRVGTTWADVTPVPEPTIVALMGVAALSLMACYRRIRS